MSYDLAVWQESKTISAAEAQAKYENAPGGEIEPSNEVVAKFMQLLTARHPQIDDATEDEVDDCPWTCDFDISENMCIMNIRWSDVEVIVPEVVAFAEDCGLLCYDPQNGTIVTGMGRGGLATDEADKGTPRNSADSEAKE